MRKTCGTPGSLANPRGPYLEHFGSKPQKSPPWERPAGRLYRKSHTQQEKHEKGCPSGRGHMQSAHAGAVQTQFSCLWKRSILGLISDHYWLLLVGRVQHWAPLSALLVLKWSLKGYAEIYEEKGHAGGKRNAREWIGMEVAQP